MYFFIEPKDKSKPHVTECVGQGQLEHLRKYVYPDAEVNVIPYPLALCFDPQGCKGKTSCPKSRSCSE